MKTITINVSEVVYQLFQSFGKKRGRPTAELIREAMERYLEENIEGRSSVLSFIPLELGSVRPDGLEMDDLFEEMIDGES